MSSGYFLGIDGGQSSTTAVIGDASGKVIGWATSGPCNHVAASEARAKFGRVMSELIGQATHNAGVPGRQFRSACLGMSGGPEDKAELLRQVVETAHLVVTHDAAIALAGALGGEPGIIVIGGTGSIAYGKNAVGETARAGGWGYIFGDEGGAFDIAREALRAILREHEGWGPRTALTPAMLEGCGARDANDLLHRFYTPEWPRARVAELAMTVSRLAEQGEPVAAGIVHRAAQQLATLATTVREQLWPERGQAAVAWVGGVFQCATLLDRFRMLAELGGLEATEPRHGPAVGALALAYQAAGLSLAAFPHSAGFPSV